MYGAVGPSLRGSIAGHGGGDAGAGDWFCRQGESLSGRQGAPARGAGSTGTCGAGGDWLIGVVVDVVVGCGGGRWKLPVSDMADGGGRGAAGEEGRGGTGVGSAGADGPAAPAGRPAGADVGADAGGVTPEPAEGTDAPENGADHEADGVTDGGVGPWGAGVPRGVPAGRTAPDDEVCPGGGGSS